MQAFEIIGGVLLILMAIVIIIMVLMQEGKGGGAARVSERGLKLLEQYERFEKEIARIAREKYREIFE